MRPMDQVVLSKNDAWTFMAIGRPLFGWDRLSAVVFSLDYLNRTMPSEAEFETSVQRLGACGLIKVSSKGFRRTRTGGALLKRFGTRTGVITIMVELMSAWDGLSMPVADRQFRFTLKPGEWQRAQADYAARWTGVMDKFKK